MLFESFPVGPLLCNCTILGDEETREAIVIDPGDDVSRIHKRLTEQGLKLKQILVTHGHIDHVGGALKLKRLTGAPIYMNENDLAQLDIMDTQAAWLGVRAPETAPPDEGLKEGQIVGLESYPAQVLHTPGHTQGSICLQYRPHRFPRRQLRPDHRLAAHAAARAARRNQGFTWPRPSHHNR
jgi:hydroxyacylglutathione hydrolase